MMFPDLERVLDHLGLGEADPSEVRRAIVEDNLLGRATMSARREAAKRLTELYGLDDRYAIFRALRRLWPLDEAARPALALLVAMARDTLLREAMPFVVALPPGAPFVVSNLVEFLRQRGQHRFSESSLRSMARNLASTWSQAGLLRGASRKTRTTLEARPASAALALFLGHLRGTTGAALFYTPWASVFGEGPEGLRRVAREAHRLGLIRVAAIEDVVEVSFRGWLHATEEVLIHEQNRSAA